MNEKIWHFETDYNLRASQEGLCFYVLDVPFASIHQCDDSVKQDSLFFGFLILHI